VFGASFDNNIICADEKECLVVSSVADKLIKGMTYNGALLVTKEQLPALEKVVFKKMYGPRKEADIDRSLIGKNASLILQKAGIRCGKRRLPRHIWEKHVSRAAWKRSRFTAVTVI